MAGPNEQGQVGRGKVDELGSQRPSARRDGYFPAATEDQAGDKLICLIGEFWYQLRRTRQADYIEFYTKSQVYNQT